MCRHFKIAVDRVGWKLKEAQLIVIERCVMLFIEPFTVNYENRDGSCYVQCDTGARGDEKEVTGGDHLEMAVNDFCNMIKGSKHDLVKVELDFQNCSPDEHDKFCRLFVGKIENISPTEIYLRFWTCKAVASFLKLCSADQLKHIDLHFHDEELLEYNEFVNLNHWKNAKYLKLYCKYLPTRFYQNLSNFKVLSLRPDQSSVEDIDQIKKVSN